ncbi:hypothetical protein [Paenibacillus sp. Aloe-11]|uniref:hypothetical protein n=1 Tax=Paenibacillus sp. Aloe-11 TaxID=1050222 RepID=UPI00031C14F9|nr:hypothetical protein [Paenibacillus sp. Aloe-11]
MPFEKGGRADKLGNRYEGRWIVKQLIRLLNEEISSVIIEPIGNEEQGVDLRIKNKDGSREYHQCKARNASKEFWDLSDLAARGIFKTVKKQLEAYENSSYQFVSAVSCMMMNDLTIRAKNSNGTSEDFYKYQINNSDSGKEVKKSFTSFVGYLGLNIQEISERSAAFELLKRIEFIQFPDDTYTKKNLMDSLKFLYVGDHEAIYSLLIKYAEENDKLGSEITGYMLNNYLTCRPDITIRKLYKDNRILPRIEELNKEFRASFLPINNSLIYRRESEICIEEILSNKSIMLHGKAGIGKSGCISEIINNLKKKNIIHLAIKLDRKVLFNNAEQFGEGLGLPASPILCLDAIAKDNEAVLILDQLDAIRWTNNHSGAALDVCKEMIRETELINENRQKKIKLLLVCRTFDFQNDRGIKSLFLNTENIKTVWKELELKEIYKDQAKQIIGNEYDNFPSKLKVLLTTPSNLYIWSNLDEERKRNMYTSSSELIKQWWDQLRELCESKNVTTEELNRLKDTIVNHIETTGSLTVPDYLLSNCSMLAKDLLLSNGMLLLNGRMVGFVHQSFYDYFSMEKMLYKVYDGETVLNVIGQKPRQTPMKRYQVQMLFENLLDDDIDKFINFGEQMLENEDIRFYIKYVFLEVLGQAKEVNSAIQSFILKFLENDYWKNHIFDAVLIGHSIYIKFLIKNGYIKKMIGSTESRDSAFLLLRSVNRELQDELTELVLPLAFENLELDQKIYSCLCWDIEDDSDAMFDLRMKLFEYRKELGIDYITWEKIIKNPERSIRMLNFLVGSGRTIIHDLNEKYAEALNTSLSDNPWVIWKKSMSYLSEKTFNVEDIYDEKLEQWEYKKYRQNNSGRVYVSIIKKSAQILINLNTTEFLNSCEEYFNNKSLIVNEILLFVMESLPLEFSDYAIKWLMGDIQKRIFNYTGENDDYLQSAKNIIEKHSSNCSSEVFKKLETELYYFHSEDEFRYAQFRFNENKERRKSKEKYISYFPYWGTVQYELLPVLDADRTSVQTIELINVLNRRFANNESYNKRSQITGGWVGSTIGSNAELLNDKQWLKIIKSKKRNDFGRFISGKDGILESNPEQFSKDLERIGKKNPNRIAKLALKFDNNVDNYYIRAIFNLIQITEPEGESIQVDTWKPVSIELAQQLFIKFSDRDEINVVSAFCRAIERRASENWSNEVLELICNLAKYHENPEEGKLNVQSSEDKEGKTINLLVTNSMNCIRGSATRAIAALLWENLNNYMKLKETIKAIVNDEHIAVNMAAIECILPIMNIERDIAVNWFFSLVQKDIRVAGHPNVYNLFYNLVETDEKKVQDIIISMYESGFEDVSELGGRHIANMNILYGYFEDIIFNNGIKTKSQKKGIVELAIVLIKYSTFHSKCQRIILFFLDDKEIDSRIFSRILNEKSVNLEEDADFIMDLVSSSSESYTIHRFIDLINEGSSSIKGLESSIVKMCKSIVYRICKRADNFIENQYGFANELSKLLTVLFEATQNSSLLQEECLNTWDIMFENRIGATRQISQSLMDY